jgi:hypothetical protein
VTERAGGTRRDGGSAGGWEDGQPGLLTSAMAAVGDVAERGGADVARARPYRCSGLVVACGTGEERGGTGGLLFRLGEHTEGGEEKWAAREGGCGAWRLREGELSAARTRGGHAASDSWARSATVETEFNT